MIIAITGTPGTGKTYLAKKLAKQLGFSYLDLNGLIKKERLYESYDSLAKTYDIDEKKIRAILQEITKGYAYTHTDRYQSRILELFDELESVDIHTLLTTLRIDLDKKSFNTAHSSARNLIIDSHLSGLAPFDFAIVIKSDIKTLAKRLRARTYPKQKITDNVESEIFDVCLEEIRQSKKPFIIIHNP